MASVRQSVIYSSLSRYLLMAIGLLSAVVAARLLTPAEVGIWAVGSAIVMILSEFRLLGAGVYLIRERELSEAKIRSALGVTYLISWALGAAVVLMSPVVAEFYDIAGLRWLFYLLSVTFFLAPFVSIPYALLQRRMDFGRLFVVTVSGATVGFIVTIASILMGLSYYSMAIGFTSNALVQLLLANVLSPERYWRPVFRGILPVMQLGAYSSASNMMKKSLLTVPDMIIGKLGTTTQVGLFSRGLGFVEFLSASVQQGVSPVVLPYLSEKVRVRADVGEAYLRASVLLGGVLWPVLAVAAVSSLPVIRFFFGDQWDQAAPLASVLAIWAMMRCVHSLAPELLLSSGHEKLLMFRELILLIVCVTGVLALFRFGLVVAAMAFVLVGMVDLTLTGWIVARRFGISVSRLVTAWWRNFILAMVCVTTAFLLDVWLDFNQATPWLVVLALALVITPVWYIGLWGLGHPLWQEINVLPRFYKVLIQEKRLPVSWKNRYQEVRYLKPLRRVLARFSQLPAIPCQPEADVELHMLTSSRDLDMALASLKSLLRFRPALAVVVHGDATLTADHGHFLKAQIPGCRVILLEEADRLIGKDAKLAELRAQIPERFSLGAEYGRQRAAWALKVFDFHALAQTDKVIVLDSDTLFIHRPVELMDWMAGEGDVAFYSVPSGPNFRVAPDDCEACFPGLEYPEKFNGGLFGYSRSQVTTKLLIDVVEMLLAHPELNVYGDECIWRLVLGHVPAQPLSFSNYPLITKPRKETRKWLESEYVRYVHFILKHKGGHYRQIARQVLAQIEVSHEGK
ncbi:MAG: lipopolysaccharide biosynthesis protein [Pseudomonadota bacterium]